MEPELEANTPFSKHFLLDHITQCREQNLSLAQYAKEHELKVNKLYYWKKRLKELGQLSSEPTSMCFTRVQPSLSGLCVSGCRLRFPNGAIMEWDTPLEVDHIARLLPLVSRLP